MIQRPPLVPIPRRQGDVGPGSIRTTYRSLRALGWSEAEAGNLSAHLAGLDVTRGGWRIREIERLLFIRSLVSTGRLDP